jgi:hypothetical protein
VRKRISLKHFCAQKYSQPRKIEIGRACGTHEGEKKWVHGFGRETGRRALGITVSRWEDNIKAYLKGIV